MATPSKGRDYPLQLGSSLRSDGQGRNQQLAAVSYNFKPASASTSAPGVLTHIGHENQARLVSRGCLPPAS